MGSFWSDFYERGLGGAGATRAAAQDGRTSPSSALATVRAVDREAEQLHRDLQRFADAEAWKKWAPFYNEWQLYRAIHAPRDAANDPDLAISNARRFAAQIFTWRSELDRARALRGGTSVGAAPAAESRSAWKPLAIIAGCVVVAMGGRYVWLKVRESQKERAERERAETQRALVAQAAGALAPGVPMVPMPAPPGYPVYPIPPYYGQPFAVMPAPPTVPGTPR